MTPTGSPRPPQQNASRPRRVWGVLGVISFLAALLGGLLPAYSTQARAPGQIESPYQVFLPITTKAPTQPALPPAGDWLGYVNFFRATAGLPALLEIQDWSEGAWLHARYIVKNDQVFHYENPNNPWYTPEGHAAAEASNLFGSFNPNETIEGTIEGWMQGPFHAVGILDPALSKTGYGIFTEPDGGIEAGAALDIIRGLGPLPPSTSFPIRWPGPGSHIPLTAHTGEYPNPLTSCPGYQVPAGLPILLLVGPGDLTPSVTDHSLTTAGQPVEHCVFDETSYVNPDNTAQALGRGILGSRNAVVLVPRTPLTPGAQYTVSITVDDSPYTWSFFVMP